jgi:ADP-ribose pyrophosphatase
MAPAERLVVVSRKQRVFDGYFKIDEYTVSHSLLNGDGLLKDVKRLVFERGDSAAVLLHDIEGDTIILTEQFRMPTYEKGPGWMIETIAGSIDDDETPEACIRREILEEVGYQVGLLEQIAKFYVSPGGTSERIFLFYAQVRPSDLVNAGATGLVAAQEDVKRIVVPRAAFLAGVRRGRYEDAKLLIAGLWLADRS